MKVKKLNQAAACRRQVAGERPIKEIVSAALGRKPVTKDELLRLAISHLTQPAFVRQRINDSLRGQVHRFRMRRLLARESAQCSRIAVSQTPPCRPRIGRLSLVWRKRGGTPRTCCCAKSTGRKAAQPGRNANRRCGLPGRRIQRHERGR